MSDQEWSDAMTAIHEELDMPIPAYLN
ncbi:hypothetical protein SEA_HANNABELLA_7 [Microbacterium phage Hannabella]|uniref:Uncharacterized protein n=1 Tax=Microbacterium phage Arete TaxID=2713257 RepID=A0A6G8R145_9CAUD|nr:hypothetical protein HWD16_gp08 [Microbacterium phage Arete]QIN93891.1 hypothetical protein SEA_ARETE_8 [Microbacterium phage Arete]UVG34256.1 hypothetical protein SEA_HANNABELLA_7 [Microbacterium phage Hannabella]